MLGTSSAAVEKGTNASRMDAAVTTAGPPRKYDDTPNIASEPLASVVEVEGEEIESQVSPAEITNSSPLVKTSGNME